MRSIAVVVLALAACGGKKEAAVEQRGSAATPTPTVPTPAPAPKVDRFAKQPQPAVSDVCRQARDYFGYGAECLETPMPALDSPAGKLTRVIRKGDPTNAWIWVLQKPGGERVAGDGGGNGKILGEVLKSFDVRTQPPALIAQLYAALYQENAIVRCLTPDDKLPPDRDGKPIACKPPAIVERGGKTTLVAIFEEFPHARLLNRDRHGLWRTKLSLDEHDLSLDEGDGLVELATDVAPPADFPPQPTMTTPPAWNAEPRPAPDDISAALCNAAIDRLSGLEGRQCKAYEYPSLAVPTGAFYYLANDAGQRHLLGFRKPDGSMLVGHELWSVEDPMKAITAAYDPAVVPPAKLLAIKLWLNAEPSRILCLPGSGDVLPEDECKPPRIEPEGTGTVLRGIVEETPGADLNGMHDDPAVRTFTYEVTPTGTGGFGATRLVDMRE